MDASTWLSKGNRKDREEQARSTGVHWSQLMELPYWDPTKQIVIDGMHMFYLGIVRHHVRGILGINATTYRTKLIKCADEATPSLEVGFLTEGEIRRVRADISGTRRPGYRVGPPVNLGELSHGSLKADEWKQAIEFDIPVSLANMWREEICNETESAHKLLFETTICLAIAVELGTSRVITATHINGYETYIHRYLELVRYIRHDKKLQPNQHNALHFSRFLTLFGPCRGWWMFPYERIIGCLQKVKTNKKVGQLESTIFRTYTESVNLKGRLDAMRGSSVGLGEILEKYIGINSDRDGYSVAASDDPVSVPMSKSRINRNTNNTTELEGDLLRQFQDLVSDSDLRIVGSTGSAARVFTVNRCRVNGRTYSHNRSGRSRATSFIYYRHKDGGLLPCEIHGIFYVYASPDAQAKETCTRCYFFVVEHFGKATVPDHENPFISYPLFGASLVSVNREPRKFVIPSSVVVCHGIRRFWEEASSGSGEGVVTKRNTYVMKPLY